MKTILLKGRFRGLIIFLLCLLVLDIPIGYMNYKKNVETKTTLEELCEAIYRVPNFEKYILHHVYPKLEYNEVIDLYEPLHMQYVLSKFNRSDWDDFINELPETNKSEILYLLENSKYKK